MKQVDCNLTLFQWNKNIGTACRCKTDSTLPAAVSNDVEILRTANAISILMNFTKYLLCSFYLHIQKEQVKVNIIYFTEKTYTKL
jgi:hypothetical protein